MPDVDFANVEGLIGFCHVWVIVDADDHPTFYSSSQLRHFVMLVEGKLTAITICAPVRWVEVEEGFRSVIFLDAGLPLQMLDVGPRETEVCLAQIFFNAPEVHLWRLGWCGAKGLAMYLSTKGGFLQEIESGSSLDIGQGFDGRLLIPEEFLPTD